ncbi:hypothetical protein GCM10009555_018010 [Acrocarpospora macrocephala]|uniref:Uncharacterized protein n=1 Tax=Acrocarpospora macrocephala TaxID=150177 RepID=A0A5M3WJT7_9ACTN|nr:hypothetical protein Amac_010560 [Acrocarpospora macrocephala]
MTSCSGIPDDIKQKRANYEAAENAVPFPSGLVAKSPTERINVAEKLKRDSDANRLSYIYIIDHGLVVAHYVAKGKVSSSDSQLLPEQEYRDMCGDGCVDYQMVTAAGDDATYGDREPGIFFFTPEGMLVTTTLDYLQFDRPMKVNTPISLVADAN